MQVRQLLKAECTVLSCSTTVLIRPGGVVRDPALCLSVCLVPERGIMFFLNVSWAWHGLTTAIAGLAELASLSTSLPTLQARVVSVTLAFGVPKLQA